MNAEQRHNTIDLLASNGPDREKLKRIRRPVSAKIERSNERYGGIQSGPEVDLDRLE